MHVIFSAIPWERKRTIRVIDTLPCSAVNESHNDQVHAAMRTLTIPPIKVGTQLARNQSELHYQCLSYAWGTLPRTEGIVVNGQDMLVTPTLTAARKRLRLYQLGFGRLAGGLMRYASIKRTRLRRVTKSR